jgi:hypothetical protein
MMTGPVDSVPEPMESAVVPLANSTCKGLWRTIVTFALGLLCSRTWELALSNNAMLGEFTTLNAREDVVGANLVDKKVLVLCFDNDCFIKLQQLEIQEAMLCSMTAPIP